MVRFLMRPADPGRFGIMVGNDPYALVEAGGDLVRHRTFEEGQLVSPAGADRLGVGALRSSALANSR